MKPRLVATAAWSMLAACAGAPPPPKTASVSPPTRDAPQPARWILDGVEPNWSRTAAVAVDGGALVVGSRGDRWLLGSSGAWKGAETALPESILAIQRVGATYRFFGARATYVADTPLGAVRNSLPHRARAARVSAGAKAVLLVRHDGHVDRSLDGGTTWSSVVLDGDPPAIAHYVEMSPSGAGTIDALFSRIWVTHDDGATWSPTSSAPPLSSDEIDARPPARTSGFIVTKAGAVALESANDVATVRRIDQSLPATTFPDCKSLVGAASASRVYVGCVVASNPSVLRLFVSLDDGSTFSRDDDVSITTEDPQLTAGPDRWLAVAEEEDDHVNVRVRMREGGAFTKVEHAWSEVEFATRIDSGPPVAIVHDSARKPSLATFGASLSLRPLSDKIAHGIGIDDRGAVTVVAIDDNGSRLLHIGPAESTTTPLPVDAGYATDFALYGKRGVAGRDNELYETDDGGRSWTRVASPISSHRGTCAEWGCVLNRTVRVGWDLSVPGTPDATPTPLQIEPGGPPLRCTPRGSSRIPDASWPLIGPLGDTRLLTIRAHARGEAVDAITIRSSELDPLSTPLLPAWKAVAGFAVSEVSEIEPEGAVAVRHQWKRAPPGSGIVSPVAAEIAWTRGGKTYRKIIPDVGRFRVGAKKVAQPRLAMFDRGVVYDPAGSDARSLHVLFDDGKAKTIATTDLGTQAGALGFHNDTVVAATEYSIEFNRLVDGRWRSSWIADEKNDWAARAHFPGERSAMFYPAPSMSRIDLRPVATTAWAEGTGARVLNFVLSAWKDDKPSVTTLDAPSEIEPACTVAERARTRILRMLGFAHRRAVLLETPTGRRLTTFAFVIGGERCVRAWIAPTLTEGTLVYLPESPDRSFFWQLKNTGLEVVELSCADATLAELRALPEWRSVVVHVPQ